MSARQDVVEILRPSWLVTLLSFGRVRIVVGETFIARRPMTGSATIVDLKSLAEVSLVGDVETGMTLRITDRAGHQITINTGLWNGWRIAFRRIAAVLANEPHRHHPQIKVSASTEAMLRNFEPPDRG